MRSLLVIFLLVCCLPGAAQDVIDINGVDCDIHGSARVGTMEYKLNEYKSRYRIPRKKDFDTTISLADLAGSGDPNQFSVNKAVIIRGYVFEVKNGGVETCNCKSKDVLFKDTHIELTIGEASTGRQFRVIAEVTPRLRLMMKRKGIDWSTRTLKKTIKGRYVELAGWLFYDAEHEAEAYANDPDNAIGRKNWRATCWEVHPITSLKIIDRARSGPGEIITQQDDEQDQTIEPQKKNTGSNRWLIAALIIGAVIVVYFVLKK